MNLLEIEQGSEAWHEARLGRVTASRVCDVIAKSRTKGAPSASRNNYAAELICERLTGKASPSFTSQAMQHGIDTEEEARSAYSFVCDADVERVGFVIHPSIPMAGASPDGFVGEDGLFEAKCPNSATHIDTLLRQEVPAKYMPQLFWQMACTRRRWCDFVSYDPRMPERMRLFVKRVEWDDAEVRRLEVEVTTFLADVSRTVTMLQREYDPPLPPESQRLVDLVTAGA